MFRLPVCQGVLQQLIKPQVLRPARLACPILNDRPNVPEFRPQFRSFTEKSGPKKARSSTGQKYLFPGVIIGGAVIGTLWSVYSAKQKVRTSCTVLCNLCFEHFKVLPKD